MYVRKETEQWRPIADFDGYEVSDRGRVRSTKRGSPRILRPIRNGHGYLNVGLSRAGVQTRVGIHRLMAQAFIANPDGLPMVRHLDDVPDHNVIENLAWGTASHNGLDAWANGRRIRPTHCPQGHELTDDNVYIDRGYKTCATCVRDRNRARYARKKARQ